MTEPCWVSTCQNTAVWLVTAEKATTGNSDVTVQFWACEEHAPFGVQYMQPQEPEELPVSEHRLMEIQRNVDKLLLRLRYLNYRREGSPWTDPEAKRLRADILAMIEALRTHQKKPQEATA